MEKKLKWLKLYAIFALIVALTVTFLSEDGTGDDVRAKIDSYGIAGVACRVVIGQYPPSEIIYAIAEVKRASEEFKEKMTMEALRVVKEGLESLSPSRIWTLTTDNVVELGIKGGGFAAWIWKATTGVLEDVAELASRGYKVVHLTMHTMPTVSDIAKLNALGLYWTISYEREEIRGVEHHVRLFQESVENKDPMIGLKPGIWTVDRGKVVDWIGTDSKMAYVVGWEVGMDSKILALVRSGVQDVYVRFLDDTPNGQDRPTIPTIPGSSIISSRMVWGNKPTKTDEEWIELREEIRKQKKPP